MTPTQETELTNLRGEVELLRHLVAQLLLKSPASMATIGSAMERARPRLGESVGEGGKANPPRIALEHAHNRFLELLR